MSRVVDRRLLRAALIAFLASRALLFVLVIGGAQIQFMRKVYSNSVWETRIEWNASRVLPELERMTMIGDAWWYQRIAAGGYDRERAAFFPLFPLLVRMTGGNFTISGIVISNVAFALALVLLGAVALRFGFDGDAAARAMWLLAFFPTSYFLSLPLTESLFLALSLGSILAAKENHWPLAGILGALAALTRFPGLLLVIPLLLIGRSLWIALVPAGTGVFMLYLQRVLGDPLAFVHAQQNWGRSARFFWTPLTDFLAHPATIGAPWNLIALNVAVAILLVFAAIALRKQPPLALYTLASVLVPLSSGSLQSLARYALVVFPLFLWLAAKERPLVLAMSAMLYGWLVAMFTLRIDFALA